MQKAHNIKMSALLTRKVTKMKNLFVSLFVLVSASVAMAEGGEFDVPSTPPTQYLINFPALPAVDVTCGANSVPAYDMIKGWVCVMETSYSDGGSEAGEGSSGEGTGGSSDNGGSEGGGF